MDVKIEKLIYGGDGLAHHDGATVFVPFVLPGEVVSAVPIEKKKKFVRGRLDSILTPSPERIAAGCPHFTVCGGCNYQHMPYEAQLQYKQQILRETLRRIGKIEWTGPIVPHPSPAWGYRNRAQWKVREQKHGGTPQIGYFHAGSTALVAIESCPILSPRIAETLSSLREMLAARELPAALRDVEAFTDERDDSLLLTMTFAKLPKNGKEIEQRVRERTPGLASLLVQDTNQIGMELFGSGFISYRAGNFSYRVSHLSFFQVNRFLVDDLMQTVMELAGSGDVVFDVFAGVGLFSLPLAKQFGQVIAAEANPVAAHDFKANAAAPENGTPGRLEVRETDAAEFLRRAKAAPDCVVVDPPRAGLENGGASSLARLDAKRIVYVSCDPATLARDLAVLRTGGYSISVVHAFDLFPQTFHIETVVSLARE